MNQEWKLKAKARFLQQRQPGMLLPIPVDEWGITVYYWQAMSLGERRDVALEYDHKDVLGAHVAHLIARARDEHGRLLFTANDRNDLLTNYEPAVIERISSQMLIEPSDVESAEKNS